jgi:hypothetical protein
MSFKKALTNQLLYQAWMNQSTTLVGEEITDGTLLEKNYQFTLDKWSSSFDINKGNTGDILEPSSIRPFGTWFETIFGQDNKCSVITWYGLLAVRKEDIHKHPRSFYETLLHMVETPNPEAGHYIERSWAAMFPNHQLCDSRIRYRYK